MSGSPRGNETRARNWDALAAIIAALIGAFALVVSGYTAYLQRTQVRRYDLRLDALDIVMP